jgi:hypothetical protein
MGSVSRGERAAGYDGDPLPVERLEARELERQVIAPRRQSGKSVAPVDFRDGNALTHHRRPRQDDRHPGHHEPLGVFDDPLEAARALRKRHSGNEKVEEQTIRGMSPPFQAKTLVSKDS